MMLLTDVYMVREINHLGDCSLPIKRHNTYLCLFYKFSPNLLNGWIDKVRVREAYLVAQVDPYPNP